MNMLARFASAWRFLTIVPFPVRAGDDETENLRRSPPLFPVVGCVIGLFAIAAGFLIWLFPPLIAAALAVFVLAAFSGGLHLDGLADSADALLPLNHSRDKALMVMKDSRIGAHGALGLAAVLLLKFACFASLEAGDLPGVLFVTPIAGRTAMLLPMALLPYARETGLGKLFSIGNGTATVIAAAAWTATALFLVLGVEAMAFGLAAWAVIGAGWVAFLRKRLGGATGDTYGAACELGELAICLAAAVVMHD